MEGLILGFWMAYFPSLSPAIWQRLKRAARLLLIPACVAGVPAGAVREAHVHGGIDRSRGGTDDDPGLFHRPGAESNRRVGGHQMGGVTSYSVYLTHALVIHVSLLILDKLHSHSLAVYFPVTFILIALVGGVFYFGVEWTSLRLRDRVAPAAQLRDRFVVSGRFGVVHVVQTHRQCPPQSFGIAVGLQAHWLAGREISRCRRTREDAAQEPHGLAGSDSMPQTVSGCAGEVNRHPRPGHIKIGVQHVIAPAEFLDAGAIGVGDSICSIGSAQPSRMTYPAS